MGTHRAQRKGRRAPSKEYVDEASQSEESDDKPRPKACYKRQAMGTALITGATGFVGERLVEKVDRPVAVLSRDPNKVRGSLGGVQAFEWRPEQGPPPDEAMNDADIVFHLAGESVVGRWTKTKKDRIRDSRIVGTRNLVEGLRRATTRPAVLVTASGVGYYGDRGDEVLGEESAPGSGFLSDVCAGWEQEALAAEELGVRVVMLRIGFVIGPGGALAQMAPAFRMGAGGRMGSGKQWVPWVHRDDVVGLAMWAAETSNLRGPLNAVAPAPVRNREFTKELSRALKRPAWLPLPRFALRGLFGELGDVMTASQRVVPTTAERAGYPFRFTKLDEALTDALEALGALGS